MNQINLYLTGYRTRHGSSGVLHFYSKKEQFQHLALWLMNGEEPTDKAKIDGLINLGEFDKAEQEIGEFADSSGHEWTCETIVIDSDRADKLKSP